MIKARLEGSPYALGAMGWAAWWWERRQNKENTQSMMGLVTAQTEAVVKNEAAIEANTKVMDRLTAMLERFLERQSHE